MKSNKEIIKTYIQLISATSWQRGLNENTNGLIRRYIPKKTEFENISNNEIMMIQDKLNHRPRKTLGYKTPFEVFFKEISSKMSA